MFNLFNFFFFFNIYLFVFLLTKIFLPFISGTLWKYHLEGDCLLLALDLPPLPALRCGHWHSASRVSALSSDSLAGFPRSGCSGDPGGGTRASSSPHLHPSPHFTPPAAAHFSSCIWIQFTISPALISLRVRAPSEDRPQPGPSARGPPFEWFSPLPLVPLALGMVTA